MGHTIRAIQAAQQRDSPTAHAERVRHANACKRVNEERSHLYPTITAENFQAVSDWQEARIRELMTTPHERTP